MKGILKNRFYILFVVAVLFSCSKSNEEDEVGYSDSQKTVVSMLCGTFVYEVYGTELTTLTFSKPYDKPYQKNPDGNGYVEITGEVTIVYWNGDTYNRYYRLNRSADRLTTYSSKDNNSVVDVKDFKYVDDNAFMLKETKGDIWLLYKRK